MPLNKTSDNTSEDPQELSIPVRKRKGKSKPTKKQTKSRSFMLKIIIALLVLGFMGSTGYFYYQYRELRENPGKAIQDEIAELTQELSKIMELPEGEEPTLATVTDMVKLQEEPFFSRAQNGDKVLVYTQAKKAILYRPSTNKIVEVAPLTQGERASSNEDQTRRDTTSGSQETNIENEKDKTQDDATDNDDEPFTVALYNGTSTIGYTYALEEELDPLDSIDISLRENAESASYERTVVIDVTERAGDVVQQIATLLDAEIVDMPRNELVPDTDILIIGGKAQEE